MNNSTLFDRLARRIDRFRDDMVDLQIRLCEIQAIAPSSGGEGEAKKAVFLEKHLKENGFDDVIMIKAPDLDAPDGYRPNIIAMIKGKKSDRTIWIMTHLDVVPPGELALWKGNPFKAWVEKGRIYGRGVEDNQQDMVASIFAARALMAENIEPAYNIGLVIVADEETGSTKGIDFVLRCQKFFRKQDLIIVPDAGNKNGTMIEVAEKSIFWLKFETLGKQAHGSTPEKGINSFKAAGYMITELDKLYRFFPVRNKLFSPEISTFEPTKKESNVPNINTIPGEDIFYMDCRILPEYSLEKVEKKIRAIANGIERKFRVKVKLETVQKAAAAPPTPENAPVVLALKKAVNAVYSKKARAVGIGGGTVAAIFRRAGYYAACWSKLEETAHMPNEYCLIDNMVGNAKVFGHIFLQE